MRIKDGKAFQVPAEGFAISASETSYTLYMSPDGKEYSEVKGVDENEVAVVKCPKNCFYKVESGNEELELFVQY